MTEPAPSNKPKVAIISPGSPVPPVLGGAIETLIHETAPFYKEFEPWVFSEDPRPEAPVDFEEGGVRYRNVRISASGVVVRRFLTRLAKRGISFPQSLSFVRSVASRIGFEPAILHLHNNFFHVDFFRRRFPRTPTVLHMHNDFLFEHKTLFSQYVKAIDAVDRIIAVSAHTAGQIIAHYPECRKKVIVIANGISLARFRKLPKTDERLSEWRSRLGIGPDDRLILYVGRVESIKGVHLLAKAFCRLHKEFPQTKLLIVGASFYTKHDGTEYRRELEKILKDVKTSVSFTGFLNHEDLAYIYNLAWVCVVPSIFNESFGLVNLEAMASGCLVVASDIGGIPEIISPGMTGDLFPPGNENALYEKLKHYLTHEAERDRIVQNALEHIKLDKDWKAATSQYEALYREILKSK